MSFSINTSPQLTIVIVLLILLVQELVEAVELLLLGAVQVVPPVAHEVLLVEDGAVGAEEAARVPRLGHAHVEHLLTCHV